MGVEDEGEGNLTLRFGSTRPRLKETVVRKLRNRHEGGFGQGMVNSSWRKKKPLENQAVGASGFLWSLAA